MLINKCLVTCVLCDWCGVDVIFVFFNHTKNCSALLLCCFYSAQLVCYIILFTKKNHWARTILLLGKPRLLAYFELLAGLNIFIGSAQTIVWLIVRLGNDSTPFQAALPFRECNESASRLLRNFVQCLTSINPVWLFGKM